MKVTYVLLLLAFFLNGFSPLNCWAGKPKVIIMTSGFSTSQGEHAIDGWDEAFKAKFMGEIDRIIAAMKSDKIDVGQTGETGNFGLKIYASLQWDCNPCSGSNIKQTQTLKVYFKLYDPVLMLEVDAFSVENTWNFDVTDPAVWLDRTWVEFFKDFQDNNRVGDWVGSVTGLKSAHLTFRPKKLGDKKPMKADGEKRGYIKINQIASSKKEYPVGETKQNPLTRYKLSVKHGHLINNGNEVKSIEFTGDEFISKRNNFEYEYQVYECNCEKYEEFELKLIEQNGVNVEQVVETKLEEFECYGYTLTLNYNETNVMTGTTRITATWNCVKIGFGNLGEEPVEMDFGAAMAGKAVDTKGKTLMPPYIIPMSVESGLTHVSAPIKKRAPDAFTFSCSGGAYGMTNALVVGNMKIDFREDYLTDPPELILVKTSFPAIEYCGGTVSAGVYLEWQFDIWGDIPELGYTQIFQVESTLCDALSNTDNRVSARVPEQIIPLMKDGKAFTFTKSNSRGSYTITGIPQQK